MKNCFRTVVASIITILLFSQCKQAYDPPVEAKNIRLLVVEGYLNSGQGPTVIRLSRTADFKDTTIVPELGAQVSVEEENGNNIILKGNAKGEYSIAQLILNSNKKYRLYIRTRDGKEYISDFTAIKHTPPIDSISWQRENGGVRLYVHSHDAQNATKYYQWKYEETWEFHSDYYSSIKYQRNNSTGRVIDLVFKYADHSVDTTIYKCWKTQNSTSIILGSSEKLAADVIYSPIHYIEPNSEKLSVLYSLNLKQYALSHEGYLFLQKMKKNTEQLGSIFDPQPSQLAGNIHCRTDPSEIVIGHVELTEEQTKRIFIYKNQVSDWNYNAGCVQFEIENNLDTINKYGADLTPTVPSKLTPFGTIAAFYAASNASCVDCTLRGTNQKPAFWP